MIIEFPPVERADKVSGLLAYGGDLEVASLELAYRSGIFPWPSDEAEPILWFAPAPRAILDFSKLHVPKRLARKLRQGVFTCGINHDFEQVIRFCADVGNRKSQSGTWITPEMIAAYIQFHKAGFGQSFEAYDRDGKLVGGMYGVHIGTYFAGESMFYHETDASKCALIHAVKHLSAKGVTWMDVQMLTPLLVNFGAEEIPRDQFMTRLQRALSG